ncbi:hypothetical protein RFI_28476 [Reticulomyxa filosa]|uniref:Uncharacterized protein n=1 Tax=Reticulomyxa filosa TaxID=46433 RepID=X6M5M8_RETFI|nr:hypothetical protein RFI_28476 [Reticulomyxa filosa]|eukprot:ETO08911.1 hypothetical protein RFI_28476 [Reticulomyxa filosa]
MIDTFHSSSKLLHTFTGHTTRVYSIDYSTFSDDQLLCSGSSDKTVRVWDVENNKQIQSFNRHLYAVYCVKFSPYHYYNNRCNIVCSSSFDKNIHFWDFKHNSQLQVFNGHSGGVCSIEFSPFTCGRYLCSGSYDKTIRLWDVETSKSLHVFNGHTKSVWCVDISPLQSNNSNKNNSIGLIGGNGYTICSGSHDNTICIWDIETTKQLLSFIGHEDRVNSIKYGSNEIGNSGGSNTIFSGSADRSTRLWDIRSGKQIQLFNGHSMGVTCVEYSPFVIKDSSQVIGGYSNVVCSGSFDNTICFWDIRSNKDKLHVIEGDYKEDYGIMCFKFLHFKKKSKIKDNVDCGVNMCYGSCKGCIRIWG